MQHRCQYRIKNLPAPDDQLAGRARACLHVCIRCQSLLTREGFKAMICQLDVLVPVHLQRTGQRADSTAVAVQGSLRPAP